MNQHPFRPSPWQLAAVALVLTNLHCGDDDVAGGSAAGSGGGAGQTSIPELNGCTESLYEDRSAAADERVIAIAASGLTYTPKCLRIHAGQQVRWQGSLTAHPLAPGNPAHAEAGSADSPIEPTQTGNSLEITFANSGTYPYYCTLHSYGTGQGMAGAVHVD